MSSGAARAFYGVRPSCTGRTQPWCPLRAARCRGGTDRRVRAVSPLRACSYNVHGQGACVRERGKRGKEDGGKVGTRAEGRSGMSARGRLAHRAPDALRDPATGSLGVDLSLAFLDFDRHR